MKPTSCGVALIREKRLLLVQAGWNQPWGFPKGKTEELETYPECALREVQEELGLKFKQEELGEYFTQNNPRKNMVIYTINYENLNPGKKNNYFKIKPNEEIYTFAWFSKEELEVIKKNFSDNQAKILDETSFAEYKDQKVIFVGDGAKKAQEILSFLILYTFY